MLKKKRTLQAVELEPTSGIVFARYSEQVLDNGQPFGSPVLHTETIEPGQSYDDQPESVQAMCAFAHTDKAIAAYKARLEAA